MKLSILAKVYEAKYGFVSEGAEPSDKKDPVADYLAKNPPTPKAAQVPAQIVAQVKRDITNAYDLYVSSKTAKEPVLQMLADAGEKFSKEIVRKFETLVSNIKKNAGTIEQIYHSVNEILGLIKSDLVDSKEVKKNVEESVRVTRQPEVNYRKHVQQKFNMVILRVSSILEKQAKLLKKFIPDAEPLAGGTVERETFGVSKEKLLMFMKTPAAQKYGLDNMSVMQKLLFFKDLNDKVHKLVMAVDRGHIPRVGPEIDKEVAEIVEAFKLKETNVGALEQSRLPNPQLERALIQQKNDEIFQKNKEQEMALKYDPSFVAQQHEKTVRDEELAERNQDFDRQKQEQEDLINKYNSLSFSDWLKRSSK